MSLENTHYGADAIRRSLASCHNLFFIGIGGISMSSLAQISLLEGYRVGGSDRNENAQTKHLEKLGVTIFRGHAAEHLRGYDAVIYTVAIGEDNPEYRAAVQAGIPVISRADYLGYLMMRYHTRIGVAGMHGKSTCTAMCAHIFMEASDPTVLCGAELPDFGGSTCRIGCAQEHFIFEACEYMDSFLDFSPTIAIVLNVDLDHVDYFHDIEQVRSSFLRYAQRTGSDGMVLVNADDREAVLSMEPFLGRKVTFGIDKPADYMAKNVETHTNGTVFDLYCKGLFLCRVSLPVSGRHNVYNALAASASAVLCGVSPKTIAHALKSFCGAGRRMERKGTLGGAVVYDDYGHHPVEIKATLSAAASMGYKRVLCAYQPHTYSRTAGLWQEFTEAFALADRVFLADIYAAREQNIYGVSSEMLAKNIGEKATYCDSLATLANTIVQEVREGDLVIVMGAGDIFKVFDLLPLT